MHDRHPGLQVGLFLGMLALATGCVSVPKLHPQFVGLGDLPLRSREPDLPPYRSVAVLPKAGAGSPHYRLGPLDQIVVTVWGRADLGSQVPIGQSGALRGSKVREDGSVVLPFLGAVEVAGKTLDETRALVQSRYAKLIENPQVEVELDSCSSQAIEITGRVQRPGQLYLCDRIQTLADAISAAGGPTEPADRHRAVLTRGGQPYHLDYETAVTTGDGTLAVLLEPGDILHFRDLNERVIYVFGEVGRQGTYPIPAQGLTILGALGVAQGLDTVTAKHTGIYLMRRNEGGFVGYKLSLAELLEGPEIPMIAEDRLFVSLTPLDRWDRWWKKALPFTTVRTDVNVGGD